MCVTSQAQLAVCPRKHTSLPSPTLSIPPSPSSHQRSLRQAQTRLWCNNPRRRACFTAAVANAYPDNTPITVDGGYSGATIVPLLSQSADGKGIGSEAYKKVHRIQVGGDEVGKAKDGAGSGTPSIAYAGAKFANTVLRGLNGEKCIVMLLLVLDVCFYVGLLWLTVIYPLQRSQEYIPTGGGKTSSLQEGGGTLAKVLTNT